MRHDDLEGAGRIPHREVDVRLPTAAERNTLNNLLQSQELEIIAGGNTGFDQDDNWRLRIDSGGQLVIEKRVSGAWVDKETWTQTLHKDRAGPWNP